MDMLIFFFLFLFFYASDLQTPLDNSTDRSGLIKKKKKKEPGENG